MFLSKYFYVFLICYKTEKIKTILSLRKEAVFLTLKGNLNVWHICEQSEMISQSFVCW